MGEKDIIIESVGFLEEHLKEPLSLESVAAQAGYSEFHFARMFREQMGGPVMEYVKQRRLLRAAAEIQNGRRILDTALDYGYETHSGFTRAFTRQFGYSPALLRAFHVRDAYVKGDRMMGLELRCMDVHMEPEALYQEFCAAVKENGLDCEIGQLQKIYELAVQLYEGRKRKSGDDYVTHPLNVAILLAEAGEGDSGDLLPDCGGV